MKKLFLLTVVLALLVVVWYQKDDFQKPQQAVKPLTHAVEPLAVPEYKPLTKDEAVQYEEKKGQLENTMKKLMGEFNNNLSDRHKRAQLEAAMKNQNEEYKQLILKLGKDALVKANNKPDAAQNAK